MKTLLLILFSAFTFQSFAQDPQLIENTWYLSNLIIDGDDNLPPVNGELPFVNFQVEADGHIYSTVCESLDGTMDFDGTTNQFTFLELYQTLFDGCQMNENADFEFLYFNFYFDDSSNPFVYTILDGSGGSKILEVVSASGDKAVYGNQLLNNEGFLQSAFKIFPNPTRDILNISVEENSIKNLAIYSISGMMVLEQNSIENSIDVSSLQNGIYFLQITSTEGKSIQKFIKK